MLCNFHNLTIFCNITVDNMNELFGKNLLKGKFQQIKQSAAIQIQQIQRLIKNRQEKVYNKKRGIQIKENKLKV